MVHLVVINHAQRNHDYPLKHCFETPEFRDFGVAEIGPPDPEIGRISRSDPRILRSWDLGIGRIPASPASVASRGILYRLSWGQRLWASAP